jgi:hypothetical protein
VTARDDSREHPLGIDGQRLHRWIVEGSEADEAVLSEMVDGAGAVVMGRRSYDQVAGDGGWGGEGPVGPRCRASCSATGRRHRTPRRSSPSSAMASRAPSRRRSRRPATRWSACTAPAACSRRWRPARSTGSRSTFPVLLGRGVRLCDHLDGIATRHVELERDRVVETPNATHLRFRVLRD